MHRYTELRSLQDRRLPAAPRHPVARPSLRQRLAAVVGRGSGAPVAPPAGETAVAQAGRPLVHSTDAEPGCC